MQRIGTSRRNTVRRYSIDIGVSLLSLIPEYISCAYFIILLSTYATVWSIMSLNDIYAQAHNKRKSEGKKRKAIEIISKTISGQEERIRKKQEHKLHLWKHIEEQKHQGSSWQNQCKRRKQLPLEGKPTMDALVEHVKKTTEIKFTLHLLCAIHDAIS